ncbi:MAG TPA: metallophosphoesterase family protein [Thermomicrobiaceae bacterium]|nr:metallophosphoesterase family protein [Thermomicrobiaceae bacterium]
MRIGLIADVHGNLVALDAVLDDLAGSGIDRIVCLGDLVALGPQPREVLARLREIGVPSARGNTDDWIARGVAPGPRPAGPDPVADLTTWAGEQLSPRDLADLGGLPSSLELSPTPGWELQCFHGSPRSDEDVIAAGTPDADLDAMLLSPAARFVAGGHTHVQLVRRRGTAWVVNPGSVGLPGVGPDSPYLAAPRPASAAEYAVLDVDGGHVELALRSMPLDVERMARLARVSGMPHAGWWAGRWQTDDDVAAHPST